MGTENYKLEKEHLLVMYNQTMTFAGYFKGFEDVPEIFKDF